MDRRIDRHPVTVADIHCESTNQVAALAGVQLGRQSQLILPRYVGVLTLLRCPGRVPQRRSILPKSSPTPSDGTVGEMPEPTRPPPRHPATTHTRIPNPGFAPPTTQSSSN